VRLTEMKMSEAWNPIGSQLLMMSTALVYSTSRKLMEDQKPSHGSSQYPKIEATCGE